MPTRLITRVALLATMYVVLGQVVRFIPNPMVPGAIIALNMVVVVIAGMVLGPAAGALVGLVGTFVNAISPAGNPFEWAAIIPHTIMGFVAGLVGRSSRVLGALTIIVGHVLNIAAFLLIGLLPARQVAVTIFSVGLLTEVVIDIIVIMIAVPLLRPLVSSDSPGR
ncbi:MAG: ECF transporter S component [Armatimonadetes bacterium]|nr:ECF transporter S component [Armatimonadota bacterium]